MEATSGDGSTPGFNEVKTPQLMSCSGSLATGASTARTCSWSPMRSPARKRKARC
jgi:hypothetical protein